LLEALILFYAAGSLIIYMMRDRRVTMDDLFVIGATFSLLAWGLSYAYQAGQAFVSGRYGNNIQ